MQVFDEKYKKLIEEFNKGKTMVLSTADNGRVSSRMMSVVCINGLFYFQTDQCDGKIVGSIQLRHTLTEELECYGGHIGYTIRPTERKKGYGKKQLSLVLEKAKQLKINQVMIACDSDNEASSKTILSCGGRLKCESMFSGVPIQIFRIELG